MRATISWLSPIIVFLIITILPAWAGIQDGLILYFSFDEAQGDTVAALTSLYRRLNTGNVSGKSATNTARY